jgi:hypothetical protein
VCVVAWDASDSAPSSAPLPIAGEVLDEATPSPPAQSYVWYVGREPRYALYAARASSSSASWRFLRTQQVRSTAMSVRKPMAPTWSQRAPRGTHDTAEDA